MQRGSIPIDEFTSPPKKYKNSSKIHAAKPKSSQVFPATFQPINALDRLLTRISSRSWAVRGPVQHMDQLGQKLGSRKEKSNSKIWCMEPWWVSVGLLKRGPRILEHQHLKGVKDNGFLYLYSYIYYISIDLEQLPWLVFENDTNPCWQTWQVGTKNMHSCCWYIYIYIYFFNLKPHQNYPY